MPVPSPPPVPLPPSHSTLSLPTPQTAQDHRSQSPGMPPPGGVPGPSPLLPAMSSQQEMLQQVSSQYSQSKPGHSPVMRSLHSPIRSAESSFSNDSLQVRWSLNQPSCRLCVRRIRPAHADFARLLSQPPAELAYLGRDSPCATEF